MENSHHFACEFMENWNITRVNFVYGNGIGTLLNHILKGIFYMRD